MNQTIDVFIPVAGGHSLLLPAALCSALTQTYSPIRVILFLDGMDPRHEAVLDKWWFTAKDERLPVPVSINPRNYSKDTLQIQHCERGVLVRNPAGPSGSAHNARQWIFEWKGKSDLVRMLDADDILLPRALEYTMKFYDQEIQKGETVDALISSIVLVSDYNLHGVLSMDPAKGRFGSGSMMLSKGFMEKMISLGFKWPAQTGHDNGFYDFYKAHESEFSVKFLSTKNCVYMYLHC